MLLNGRQKTRGKSQTFEGGCGHAEGRFVESGAESASVIPQLGILQLITQIHYIKMLWMLRLAAF